LRIIPWGVIKADADHWKQRESSSVCWLCCRKECRLCSSSKATKLVFAVEMAGPGLPKLEDCL